MSKFRIIEGLRTTKGGYINAQQIYEYDQYAEKFYLSQSLIY